MKRKLVVLLAVAAGVLTGMVVTELLADKALADGQVAPAGKYGVSTSEGGFVLVDGNGGNAWILRESERFRGRFVWIPIRRIEDDRKAEEWRLQNLVEQ